MLRFAWCSQHSYWPTKTLELATAGKLRRERCSEAQKRCRGRPLRYKWCQQACSPSARIGGGSELIQRHMPRRKRHRIATAGKLRRERCSEAQKRCRGRPLRYKWCQQACSPSARIGGGSELIQRHMPRRKRHRIHPPGNGPDFPGHQLFLHPHNYFCRATAGFHGAIHHGVNGPGNAVETGDAFENDLNYSFVRDSCHRT